MMNKILLYLSLFSCLLLLSTSTLQAQITCGQPKSQSNCPQVTSLGGEIEPTANPLIFDVTLIINYVDNNINNGGIGWEITSSSMSDGMNGVIQSAACRVTNITADGFSTVGFSASLGATITVTTAGWSNSNCNGNGSCCDQVVLTFEVVEGALPVELTFFEGNTTDEGNQLEWQTASEENAMHFMIQRSLDGSKWTELGFVYAAGNSEIDQDYNYFDPFPLKKAYYRLKMVDLDGSYEYSKVIALSRDSNVAAKMSIYPNPSSLDQLNVSLQTEKSRSVEIFVTDLSGKHLVSTLMDSQKGFNFTTIDVSSVPEGVYFVHFRHSEGMVTQRFIKLAE